MLSVKLIFQNSFRRNPALWASITGAIFGFLLLRLYIISIYSLFYLMETGKSIFYDPIYIEDPGMFQSFQLLISISFIFFGGLIGLIFGKWYDRRQKHIMERIEREKHDAAIETLKELTVTLSHYIINSSSIIRGFAQRGYRNASNEKVKEYFSIIHEEVDKTIAVIKGLENLKEIELTKYIESGTALMIDLKKQIEEQLKIIKSMEEKTLS